jgi:hypothetical protein
MAVLDGRVSFFCHSKICHLRDENRDRIGRGS